MISRREDALQAARDTVVRSGFHKQDRIGEIENLDLIRLDYCAILASTRLSNEQAVSPAGDHPLLTSLERSGCHLLRSALVSVAGALPDWPRNNLSNICSDLWLRVLRITFYLLFIVFV